MLFAVRQRSRKPTSEAVDVIVFGAGDAGSMLISRLTHEPDSAYRPVAILDDDPAKRRLRIQGIPVLGDRTQMAEGRRADRGHRSGHRDRAGQRHRDPGPHRRGGAVRAHPESGARPSPSCSTAARASRECATRGSATCWAAGRYGRTSPRSPIASRASASWSPGRADRSARSCAASCTVQPGRADHARPGRVRAARRSSWRCTAAPCWTPTRRSWPTSAIRIGSGRYSGGSARRSSSTRPRSSISRCWSVTRPRR